MTRKGELQRLADRAAWLRKEASAVRNRALADAAYARRYWAQVEQTAGWATFTLGRRSQELARAVLGRRGRR